MVRIGIFDSGIGGLSMLRDIRKDLPAAEIVYYGDTRNVPYGGRPTEDIERLSLEALEVVRGFRPDIVVVACNTATSVAIQKMRSTHSDLPIVGVVPVIKKAAEKSVTKKIAVLATSVTLTSHSYATLKQTFAGGVDVLDVALPEWVTMTEHGDLTSPDIIASIEAVAKKIRDFGADVVALGCTHFVFLRPQIEAALPGVTVMDSGSAVARQAERLLRLNRKLAPAKGQGSVTYVCSGDPAAFSRVASTLLGENVSARKV